MGGQEVYREVALAVAIGDDCDVQCAVEIDLYFEIFFLVPEGQEYLYDITLVQRIVVSVMLRIGAILFQSEVHDDSVVGYGILYYAALRGG